MRCALVLYMNKVADGSPFIAPDGVATVARAADAAGFDAVAVTDHPLPTAEWMASGGHHALDPLAALAFVAGVTMRVRLLTYIYVLPYRNPFLTAKGVASVDVLSGGRMIFGIAAGYLEPEFDALGVPFAERNDRCDEAIRAMQAAWAGGPVEFDGRFSRAHGHTVEPRPLQRPRPPIWVGGNSKLAIRRAVALCDGWMPIYNPPEYAARRRTPAMQTPDDIRRRLGFAKEVADEVGRTAPLEVVWTAQGVRDFGTPAFEHGKFQDGIGALEAAGVTYFTVHLGGRTPAEQADLAARFGADLLR